MIDSIKPGDIFRIVRTKDAGYKIQRRNPKCGKEWDFMRPVQQTISYKDLNEVKEQVMKLRKEEQWLADISEVVEVIEV